MNTDDALDLRIEQRVEQFPAIAPASRLAAVDVAVGSDDALVDQPRPECSRPARPIPTRLRQRTTAGRQQAGRSVHSRAAEVSNMIDSCFELCSTTLSSSISSRRVL